MLPVIGRNLLSSVTLLSSATRLLADTCVAGITAHDDRLRRAAESSPAIVTALNPFLGYEAAAAIAHQSLETGETIRDVTIARGHVERGEITVEQLDQALDVLSMAWPHGHPAASQP
jgi:fumarate hydratase class II